MSEKFAVCPMGKVLILPPIYVALIPNSISVAYYQNYLSGSMCTGIVDLGNGNRSASFIRPSIRINL